MFVLTTHTVLGPSGTMCLPHCHVPSQNHLPQGNMLGMPSDRAATNQVRKETGCGRGFAMKPGSCRNSDQLVILWTPNPWYAIVATTCCKTGIYSSHNKVHIQLAAQAFVDEVNYWLLEVQHKKAHGLVGGKPFSQGCFIM